MIARLAILLLLAAVPAIAATMPAPTIKPGTYHLQWLVPERGDRCYLTYLQFALHKIKGSDRKSYPWVKSDKSLSGSGSGIRVVIDESKGTGSGYDVAYLFSPVSDQARLDVGQAIVFALKLNAQGQPTPKSNDEPMMEWAVGAGDGRRVVRAPVNLGFGKDRNGSSHEMLCRLWLRGGWYGKVPTDAGDRDLLAKNQGGEGFFSRRGHYDKERGEWVTGDGVFIGNLSNSHPVAVTEHTLWLGKASSYAGKLYSLDVSSSGDTVTFDPYNGETGRLKLEMTDGRGRPVNCWCATVKGEPGYFGLDPTQASELLPGTYDDEHFALSAGQGTADEPCFQFEFWQSRKITIESGKTAAFKIGGPLSMTIEPDSGRKTVKLGEKAGVSVNLYLGEDWVHVFGRHICKFKVTDAAGAIVKTGVSENDLGFDYSFEVAKDWKPGTYTVTATLDAEPYQGQLAAACSLVVGEQVRVPAVSRASLQPRQPDRRSAAPRQTRERARSRAA
jgi:hypothetical protein